MGCFLNPQEQRNFKTWISFIKMAVQNSWCAYIGLPKILNYNSKQESLMIKEENSYLNIKLLVITSYKAENRLNSKRTKNSYLVTNLWTSIKWQINWLPFLFTILHNITDKYKSVILTAWLVFHSTPYTTFHSYLHEL
jgi:hypothetical protein